MAKSSELSARFPSGSRSRFHQPPAHRIPAALAAVVVAVVVARRL
jgi:hypothetical protein